MPYCYISKVVIILLMLWSVGIHAKAIEGLTRLQQSYPKQIIAVKDNYLVWSDGSRLPISNNNKLKSHYDKLVAPSLLDQVNSMDYPQGQVIPVKLNNDPGRIRYEPFFQKMYGKTRNKVEKQLTTIYWMPKIFGNEYPLRVTTINGVDKKLTLVSQDLEKLIYHKPEYLKYLDSPGGTFKWRGIANTNRMSPHSFGISIDINAKYGNYWQWDLKKENRTVSEKAILNYKNQIPLEIVEIFEKHGFIWGGKWYHYDTIHFEYRPEVLLK